MSQTPAAVAAPSPDAVPELLGSGRAHHAAGRLAEAEAAYRRILAADAEQPDALHLLGVIALQVGKPAAAVELIARAARRSPTDAVVFSNLGSALRRCGRPDEAVAAARRAVELDGRFPDALNNLANALADTQAHAETADVLTRYVALRPEAIDQRLLLARALILSGRAAAAVEVLNALLARAPRHAPALINLGVALKKTGRTQEAIAAYRTALEIAPDDVGALNNLGTAYQEEDRHEEAIACFRAAIERRPDFADAHLNLALAHRAFNRIEAAIGSARAAIARAPDQAEAHTLLGYCLLLQGRLEEGFAEYEWRTLMADFTSPRRTFDTPAWDGRDPAGLTLLVHDEQGVGDAIQFVRYAALLRRRGARVIVECNTQLTRLFTAMPGIDGTVGRFSPPPPHDAHVSMLSLPHLLGTTLDTVPAEVPYLAAEPELAAAWRDRMGPRRGLRVGLVWAGNPEFKDDRNRSPGLRAVLPLLGVPGVEVFILQKGGGRAELDTLRDRLPGGVVDLGPSIGNFADTAAIMENLDLVISSCTAPPHLAGALARPVWTILPFNCDWRWMTAGSATPWYPTMRLFRQERRGDWEPVVGRVRAALAEAAATRSL